MPSQRLKLVIRRDTLVRGIAKLVDTNRPTYALSLPNSGMLLAVYRSMSRKQPTHVIAVISIISTNYAGLYLDSTSMAAFINFAGYVCLSS